MDDFDWYDHLDELTHRASREFPSDANLSHHLAQARDIFLPPPGYEEPKPEPEPTVEPEAEKPKNRISLWGRK